MIKESFNTRVLPLNIERILPTKVPDLMLTHVSIPDMSAICTPEVELPTLSLDSSQLTPSISSSPVATITLQPAHSGGYTLTTDTQVTTLELSTNSC